MLQHWGGVRCGSYAAPVAVRQTDPPELRGAGAVKRHVAARLNLQIYPLGDGEILGVVTIKRLVHVVAGAIERIWRSWEIGGRLQRHYESLRISNPNGHVIRWITPNVIERITIMQAKPDYLDQLIEKASTAAGSDYKLAALLEVPRQNLSAWKHGRKTCPVGDVALMAEIAGLKPEEWIARAVVKQYEGTSKGDKLFRALGKALAVTGAAIASSGASAHLISSLETPAKGLSYLIRCIVLLTYKQLNYRSSKLITYSM